MEIKMSDARDYSLGEILERVGTELAKAAKEVDDLHAVVAFASEDGFKSDVFIKKVQTIDLLQQHLQALSIFTLRLSESAPANWVVAGATTDDVKLSRLRESLTRVISASEGGDQESGDLLMF